MVNASMTHVMDVTTPLLNSTEGTSEASPTEGTSEASPTQAVGIQGFSLGMLYFGDLKELRYPIYGYAWPIVTVLTTLTSLLICAVLFRKSMRTPTNIVLGSIAVANMMTCLSPMPVMLYLFWTDVHLDYIQGALCYGFKVTLIVLPVMFHNVSIWLTVLLAMQHVLVVRYPLKCRSLITAKNTAISVITLSLIAMLAHIIRCLDSSYKMVPVASRVYPNVTVTGCEDIMHTWIQNPNIYFSIYFWLRSFFMHFVPCVCLVVLNSVLIHTMRMAYKERKRLTGSGRNRDNRQSQTQNRTTAMLIAVVSVFLLVEVPIGIILIIIVVPNTFGILLLDPVFQVQITTVADFIILCSYPINFIIYSVMSKKFRDVFIKTFCCSSPKDKGKDLALSTITDDTCLSRASVTTSN